MVNAVRAYMSGIRTLFHIVFLLGLSWHSIQSFAQTTTESPWKDRIYLVEKGELSEYDSLISATGFSWNDADAYTTGEFKRRLAGLYTETFNMEWIRSDQKTVQRYIINYEDGGIDVLEKVQYPKCIQFYFKNGIPESEMKFYKLVTSYYEQ